MFILSYRMSKYRVHIGWQWEVESLRNRGRDCQHESISDQRSIQTLKINLTKSKCLSNPADLGACLFPLFVSSLTPLILL